MTRTHSRITRRSALKTVGAGVLGGGTLVGAVSANPPADSEGELPNDNVEYSTVLPFGCRDLDREACSLQEVPTGDWVLHTVAWVAGGAGGKLRCAEDIEELESVLTNFLENADTRAWIDGEEISNAHQYWSDPREPRRQKLDFLRAVEWEYFTPPKEKGSEQLFRIRISIDDRTWTSWETDDEGNCVKAYLEDYVADVSGGYEVTAPADRDAGPAIGALP